MRAVGENFGNLGYKMTIFPAYLRRVTFNGGLACDLFPKESSLYRPCHIRGVECRQNLKDSALWGGGYAPRVAAYLGLEGG